jgi:hypothetical protein
MTLLFVIVVLVLLAAYALWWWITRPPSNGLHDLHDLGTISPGWRDEHGRDQGTKGGPL